MFLMEAWGALGILAALIPQKCSDLHDATMQMYASPIAMDQMRAHCGYALPYTGTNLWAWVGIAFLLIALGVVAKLKFKEVNHEA